MYMIVFSFLIVVDCGTLNAPANGQVSHTAGTTFGQTATYSCDTGYNLVGDSNHTCRATGVWSGCAPTCQGTLLLEIEYYLTYVDIARSVVSYIGEWRLRSAWYTLIMQVSFLGVLKLGRSALPSTHCFYMTVALFVGLNHFI